MRKLYITALLLLFSIATHANTSQKNNAEKKEVKHDQLISSLYGRWEGNIDYQYFENSTQNQKYSHAFGIEITPNSIEFFNKNDAGEWKRIKASFANSFTFSIEKNTISGYFLNSGTDTDGLWVESQSMYITLKDDKTILIYNMRAVNNTGMTDSKPGSKWMEMGTGELQKK